MLYVRNVHLTRPNIFIRDKPIFSSERMLHKDYYRKSSVEKISGLGLKGLDASRKVTMTLTLISRLNLSLKNVVLS
jgi:hypothetical protein